MKTSLAVVFNGQGLPLIFQEVALPKLRTGEVLVRNEYTTLCRSDLNTYSGKRVEKTPTILGHEVVGRIERLGPAAPLRDLRGADLRVGDRVTWAIYASDPNTPLALAGIPQKAPGLFKYGHERIEPGCHLHGGLAQHCLLRANTPIVRVDAPVPLPLIALVNCAVATVAGAFRLAGNVAGRDVLVGGVGMLGTVACAMARVAGAGRVTALDVNSERLETACQFGADARVLLGSDPLEALQVSNGTRAMEHGMVAFDFSGIPATMETLISMLGVGGVAVLVGATFPQPPLRISAECVVRNLLTLKGLHNYNDRDLVAAVEFMERWYDRFPFGSLVHDGFSLGQAREAFEFGLTSRAYRVGLRL
ncbi:MAG: zinc-binding dehydrogenase [Verrucomicrobiales bacterium]|nr:zinc-binding dehydrogenase [Verrucomicrobiales bacterium]